MKKVICKKTYDTETATLIKAYSFSQLGDPAGYEEDLYQTPEGLYFLHVGGGETSIYPAEDIVRMAKTKVKDWMEKHIKMNYWTINGESVECTVEEGDVE